VHSVRFHRQREINVVVYQERHARFPAQPGERFGQQQLKPLLAVLVSELNQPRAALDRLPRYIERVAASANGRVDDDVQAT
jgi:hypothetical protein